MRKRIEEIKKIVKQKYDAIARSQKSSCCSKSCCSSSNSASDISKNVGYSQDELNRVPSGSNLGLGCGNPVALSLLKEGDTVLDLGSGAGFDAFLAAENVGKTGCVIGVDMTQTMVEKARANAKKGGYTNVEFLLGEIEKLPVEDNTIDIIISNCVINLSPDKEAAFKEAFRVLKPGGSLTISDLVLTEELSNVVQESVEAYVGCLAGAVKKKQYLHLIKDAGFEKIKVVSESGYPMEAISKDFKSAAEAALSIKVLARKYKGGKNENRNSR